MHYPSRCHHYRRHAAPNPHRSAFENHVPLLPFLSPFCCIAGYYLKHMKHRGQFCVLSSTPTQPLGQLSSRYSCLLQFYANKAYSIFGNLFTAQGTQHRGQFCVFFPRHLLGRASKAGAARSISATRSERATVPSPPRGFNLGIRPRNTWVVGSGRVADDDRCRFQLAFGLLWATPLPVRAILSRSAPAGMLAQGTVPCVLCAI